MAIFNLLFVTLVLQIRAPISHVPRQRAKLVAVLSLLLWTAVITRCRLLAYL